MFKKHGLIHSTNGKRMILVVDDEQINREILGFMLSEDYEVIYAENGRIALDIVRENKDTLSLVMTDILMPEMDGFELVQAIKGDDELKRLPIIVLTTEREFEIKSLRMGASDFIKKPYDFPEVVLARVRRIIELSEDRYIIEETETDDLTGLYNQEYFFKYAGQFDLHHRGQEMDAVVIDIEHFHFFNELYGREDGDRVLVKISDYIKDFLRDGIGLACRKNGDNFLVYLKHGDGRYEWIDELRDVISDESKVSKIRLITGVYPCVSKEIDVRTRFDRAKHACNMLKEDPTRSVAVYDENLHKKNMFLQSLADNMESALSSGQFVVYYQPKFDITGDKPVLSSAEALIRWIHPEKGIISPDIFIPLFEKNGMIKLLDRFVWREAAAQMRRWRDEFGVTVPISVNISRIDLYDPDFIPLMLEITEQNGIDPHDYLLEVTESAYTEESERIVAIVNELRSLGFRVEMDDFGSGYSSLNMLAELPIDVLKIDMIFVRNLLTDQKNERIFKLMIDIASHLDVPVVAEGVETKEQLDLLKKMGCDLIQGYYFSAPVPAEKFEKFIEERKQPC